MANPKIVNVIDLGSSKATAVIAAHTESGEFNVIGFASTPTLGFKRGQIVDIENVISSLDQSVEEAERMAGVNMGSAYVSVGSCNLISKNSHGVVAVSEPNNEISQNDITRVIEAARAITLPPVQEVIHVIPRNFSVDGQEGIRDPRGMMGIRLEVETHIIAESLPNLRNIRKVLKELGIEIEKFVFAGLASSMAVLSETEKDLGVIMLDVGSNKSDLAVWIDGSLAHSAVLPVGGLHVTKDIALGLQVSLESAEKIKVFVSQRFDNLDEESRKKEQYKDAIDVSSLNLIEGINVISKKTLIDGIIVPRLTEIFALAGETLEKNNLLNLTPSGIVLTGGGSQIVNCIEVARHKMLLPARLGAPKGYLGLAEEIQTPQMASPAGLLKFALLDEKRERKQGLSLSFLKKVSITGISSQLGKLLKNLLP